MKNHFNLYLSIGILGFFVFGSFLIGDIYEAFYADQNIWWTNQDMMVPLDNAKDRVEIWINGVLLQKRLDEKALYAAGTDGNPYPLVSKDIGLRFNNWHSRQVDILKFALFRAFFTGASLAFILVGIVQIFQEKKPRSRLPG